MNEGDKVRFRSFAERYIIARATTFTVGNEANDAWKALLDAKSIYRKIKASAATFDFTGETDAQL